MHHRTAGKTGSHEVGTGADDPIRLTQDQDHYFLWFDDGYLSFRLGGHKQKFIAVHQAPAIKNVVLAGGASRGLLYLGALEAFEECRYDNVCGTQDNRTFMEQLEAFSGTSIGAVVSAFAASGMRADELRKEMKGISFKELLGKGWRSMVGRDGKPLYQLLRKNITYSIRARLTELMGADTFPVERVRDYLVEQAEKTNSVHLLTLHQLADELEKTAPDDPPIITFLMLRALHSLHPTIFKDLYVAAVCSETDEVCYLSADTSPDLEIALACRASASIPIVVNRILIEKKYIHCYRDKKEVPEFIHFIDGGYLDNNPFLAVDTRQKKEIGFNVGEYGQNLHSLIILPDDSKAATYEDDAEVTVRISDKSVEKSAEKAPEKKPTEEKYPQSPFLNARSFSSHELSPPSFIVDFICNTLPKAFGFIKTKVIYTENREQNLLRVRREFLQRNIPINSGLTPLDFDKAEGTADSVIKKGREAARDYLKTHSGEYICFSYDSLPDLIKNLPEDKYQWLLRNRFRIDFLKDMDVKKIQSIRDKHRQNPVSPWPRFDRFFVQFNKLIYDSHLSGKLIETLWKHFYIISIDESSSDYVKMLRALSIVLDLMDELSQAKENEGLCSFFIRHFKKDMQLLDRQSFFKQAESVTKMNAQFELKTAELTNSVFSREQKDEFFQCHPFYSIYQRIIFKLKNTKSSLVNPEDQPHQRCFIETILNEIHDLSALSMSESQKLKRLENYLFEIYHKILFYKGSNKSNIAQTVKDIINSPDLLNLPFIYGIQLPDAVTKKPVFLVTPMKSGDQQSVLDRCYERKLKNFTNAFKNVIDIVHHKRVTECTMTALAKHLLPLTDSIDLRAQVIFRAITQTMTLSPYTLDRFYAKRLKKLITPRDVQQDIQSHRALFYAMSLLTRLSWIKPAPYETLLYANIMDRLFYLMDVSLTEGERVAYFKSILEEAQEALQLTDRMQSTRHFFGIHSDFYSLLQNFITKETGLKPLFLESTPPSSINVLNEIGQ